MSQVRILSSRYYGGVAQLARASGSYPGGRGFDPLRRYIVDLVGPLAQLVRALGSSPSGRRFKSYKVHYRFWRITQVRLKGTVLKTVRRVKACVGSNPTSSLILTRDGAAR